MTDVMAQPSPAQEGALAQPFVSKWASRYRGVRFAPSSKVDESSNPLHRQFGAT